MLTGTHIYSTYRRDPLGNANSGHYYSLVQEREVEEGEWFNFNDHIVKPFSRLDLPAVAYGTKVG